MMNRKRAIGYVRISSKDQSNFSLDGQEEFIRRHSERNQWELVEIVREEGQSAKNFDRPNWKLLEAFLKKNHRYIDYLVVAKYDRFSRNVSEALQMIDKIEQRYKIRILSVMEPINLHPESPYFFRFRTEMLVGAQVELMIIKERTKFGLVQAARSGRHPTSAPYGYRNVREARNKPLLQVIPEEAAFVKQAYKLFLSGLTMAEITKQLRKHGMPLRGNSAMQRLLTNHVYTGLVQVPAYYDDPAELVEGKHQPIIDRATWWQVQSIIGGKHFNRVVYNDQVPLRGLLLCHCNKPFTAGNSKGRSRHYWYYKCAEHKENLRADKLHAQLDQLINELSLSDVHIKYLQQIAAQEIESRLAVRTAEINNKRRQLKAVESSLHSLEEKFIQDLINVETYRKWHTQYSTEKHTLLSDITKLQQPAGNKWQKYKDAIHLLGNIPALYHRGNIHQKQAFLNVVFKRTLKYVDGIYRTQYLMDPFMFKAALLKEKRLLEIEQPMQLSGEIPVSSVHGNSFEPFTELLDWAMAA